MAALFCEQHHVQGDEKGKRMDRKALFFDIDGTLLSEETRQIPQSAKDALKEARKRGHLVFINSGRSYIMVKPIMEEVECDGCLCGCGTCIVIGDEIVYSYHIPHERGNEIKRSLLAHEMDGTLEGSELFPERAFLDAIYGEAAAFHCQTRGNVLLFLGGRLL